MFWGDMETPFKRINLNAEVVRYFIGQVENVECRDHERVQRVCQRIEDEIHNRLSMMDAVPPMETLFVKHYEDPAGAGPWGLPRPSTPVVAATVVEDCPKTPRVSAHWQGPAPASVGQVICDTVTLRATTDTPPSRTVEGIIRQGSNGRGLTITDCGLNT